MSHQTVVITSMGVVSPVGTDRASFAASLRNSKTGIRRISRFDPRGLKTMEAGQADLERVISDLGIDSCKPPWSNEPILLADNPKLAFAMHASLQVLLPPGTFPVRNPASSPKNVSIPTALTDGLAIYGTTGLEEIRCERLSHPLPRGIHVCEELPPALAVEALASFLGIRGVPPVSIASACAASTQAVGEAFRAVRSGRVPRALAGGFDSMIFPFGMNAFNSIGALSESGNSRAMLKPFDESRNGTIPGEGAAMFLLEPLEAALEAGRTPLAVMTGYASTLDGYHQVKPRPGGEGAVTAMRRALNDAGVSADSIVAINAHGSGTRANDEAEAKAIWAIFGKARPGPCVSSSKSCFGHLLTAAGAIELAALLCGIGESIVHPTQGLDKVDPALPPLDFVRDSPRRVGSGPWLSNSFGLNGQNGVLIVEPWNRSQ